VRELLELGRIDDVDAAIRATVDRRDLVTWTTMRALLDGREDVARRGLEDLLGLARATEDRSTWDRYWAQRFWAAVEWGGDDERHDVLDHCRERAYRFDELEWWGRLTVLLATMGKADEATRAFDETLRVLERSTTDERWFDALTDLVDAAALQGDWARVALIQRSLPEGGLLVIGAGVVCKGSVDRYRALAYLAIGDRARAARCFDTAAATHEAIGAGPLLARTRQQARAVSVAA
jgi:tetratricopeptide (TPR) repeat protein